MAKNLVIFMVAALMLVSVSPSAATPPYLTTDKSVDPTVIYLPGAGTPDEATVTLSVTAHGDPQVQTFPIDVALLMDRSGSMEGQKMQDAKDAAIYFCSLLNLLLEQSSLVSFADWATLDQELTNNHQATMIAIKALVAWGGTAIGSAIYTAQDELTSYRHRPSSLPVMVVMSDGESNRGPDPIPAAEQAKAAGTAIYAIGLGEDVNEAVMKEIASDPDSEYYYFAPSSADLDSIYERVHEHLSYLAARQTLATEILADSIHYVPGSFSIDPISISGDIAVWELGILNIGDVWTVDFNITATQPGHLPVDDYPRAEVTYLNYLGESERVPFPQAYIDVLPPASVQEDLKPGDWGATYAEIAPNPFSSFPAIRYSLAQSAWVTLEIYNLAGELVRTLVAEPKPAGTHLLSWDTKDDQAGDVPSGVYLLRLKAGDSASTQKMVLLR